MILKELPIGAKFKSPNNETLVFVKGAEGPIRGRILISCKSQIGTIHLPPELEINP